MIEDFGNCVDYLVLGDICDGAFWRLRDWFWTRFFLLLQGFPSWLFWFFIFLDFLVGNDFVFIFSNLFMWLAKRKLRISLWILHSLIFNHIYQSFYLIFKNDGKSRVFVQKLLQFTDFLLCTLKCCRSILLDDLTVALLLLVFCDVHAWTAAGIAWFGNQNTGHIILPVHKMCTYEWCSAVLAILDIWKAQVDKWQLDFLTLSQVWGAHFLRHFRIVSFSEIVAKIKFNIKVFIFCFL